MNKTTISIIVLVLIIIGFFFLRGDGNDAVNETSAPVQTQSVETTEVEGKTIVIQGHKLPVGDLEIEVGTTIAWTNKDNLVGLPYDKHTVTSGAVGTVGTEGVAGVVPNSGSGVSDGLYQQGLALNDNFEYTFTKPGAYTFYIAEHPLVSGEGKIIVTEKVQLNSVQDTENIIAMESKSFSFSLKNLQAKVGEPVRLDITSTGKHTFTIDELGVNVITPHGETTRVEFTPEKAGTFEYYCAIPGHKEAGMIGVLTVE